MNTRTYMLDTNTVSALLSRSPQPVLNRLRAAGSERTSISSIVYGEVRYGLSKNPTAIRFLETAEKFFAEIAILPWMASTAEQYGTLRAEMRRTGRALQPLDMLIAAHALEARAVLVTRDQAFRHVPGLTVEDWSSE